ncbi:hypothetical protein M885DRAFT_624697 [Pelagophyceae sp. CCMP2097]|nr:hypothetical protein M885DRAFT_624697 [Pelagophyceae sp. CCMP2097]
MANGDPAWQQRYSAESMVRAISTRACAASSDNAAKRRPSGGWDDGAADAAACAFVRDVAALRRLEVEDGEKDFSEDAAGSFNERVSASLRDSAAAVFTVVDGTRSDYVGEFLAAMWDQAGDATPLVVTVGTAAQRAACAARANHVAWRPADAKTLSFFDAAHASDDVFYDRAMGRGACSAPVRGSGGADRAAPKRCVEAGDSKCPSSVAFSARWARHAAARHAAIWATVAAILEAPQIQKFAYVDASTAFVDSKRGVARLFEGLPPRSGAVYAVARSGVDARNEVPRSARAPLLGGQPAAAVLAWGGGAVGPRDVAARRQKALFLSGLCAAASSALLGDVAAVGSSCEAKRNDTALGLVGAAADVDSLLRCAAYLGLDPKIRETAMRWGCDVLNDAAHAAAHAALRGASGLGASALRARLAGALGVFDAETVVSGEYPAISASTVAVHVRQGDDNHAGDRALANGGRSAGDGTASFSGVAFLHRDLGLARGAGECPRCVGGPRRFLAVEDAEVALLPPDFHFSERLSVLVLNLVALGFSTGRTVVLPTTLFHEKYYSLAEWVDVQAVAANLDVRMVESGFLQHHALQRRGAADFSVARVALRADGAVGAQRLPGGSQTQPSSEAWFKPQVPAGPANLGKRLLWAVANEHAAAAAAAVLYVDFEAPATNPDVFPDVACFHRRGGCKRHGAEPWMAAVHAAGASSTLCARGGRGARGWCFMDKRAIRGANAVAAADECGGKRVEDARTARIDHLDLLAVPTTKSDL